MKKLLLLAILLSSFSNIFAFTTQGNWRWRNDDGTQVTATWLAAQNIAPIITSPSDIIRLRIELYNDVNNAGGALADALFEDSSNIPGAKWTTITVAADADDAFVLAGSSPNLTDKEPTTQQLTGATNASFKAGKVIVATEKLPSQTLGDGDGTEYEYAIKPTANIVAGVTYYFRVDAANYPADKPLPSLTTSEALPVKLSNFTAKSEGKQVKLEWITVSEENNDRFDVQRSGNGIAWETIAKVKGKGNSSSTNKYVSYDVSPLRGTSYYRLQQFDINGRSSLSAVKMLKMFGANKAMISVSPNPARGAINFTFENQDASNIIAILTDAGGKVIHQEKFKNVQANTMNRLSLKQPPTAGMYILKLTGENLSETIKIIVQ
ncbi:hypothetical protein BH10BAC3_BH10BAC3_18470 [soil metagenome]